VFRSSPTFRPYNARMSREDGPEGEAGRPAPGGVPAAALRKQGR
jgi:hypothetical protein